MDLNPDQQKAVETIDGPVLVVSAPGSGKTRVVTERIKRILESGASPVDILAIAFTNSAAREMKERLVRDLGDRAHKLTVCTFHKLAIQIIRTYGHLLGYRPDFSIYDEQDQLDIVRSAMKDLNIKKPKPEKVLRNLRGLAHKKVFAEYQDQLRASNAFDFDALIETAVILLQTFDQVREDLSYKYRYISVDEFQDINNQQYQIAKVLSSKWGNLCAVGDPSQNIFTFQGANLEHLLNMTKEFPNLTTVTNDTVYRCPANILHKADTLIRYNQNRLVTNPCTDNKDGVINVQVFDNSFEEASWIAAQCKDLHNRKKIPYNHMAVLYRMHRLASEIQGCLKAANVPANKCGRTRNFFREPVVKEFHSYLKVLNNQYDDLSFRQIVNSPPRGISYRDIIKAEIVARASDLSVVEGARIYFQKKGIDITWLNEIISWKDLTFKGQVGKVKDTLREFYKSKDLLSRCDQLDTLEEFTKTWQSQNYNCGIKEYLEDISEMSAQDDVASEGDEDSVQLMTIHTAKGLEFPVVFVPGLEQGTFPITRASTTDEELEEERRLFYVAITRAKDMLFLSRADKRENWGKEQEMDPSCFLAEMEL